MNTSQYQSVQGGGVRTYNSGLNWCVHALHLAGVAILEDLHCIRFRFFLVRTGFPLYLEQVNIDTIIWHKKEEGSRRYLQEPRSVQYSYEILLSVGISL